MAALKSKKNVGILGALVIIMILSLIVGCSDKITGNNNENISHYGEIRLVLNFPPGNELTDAEIQAILSNNSELYRDELGQINFDYLLNFIGNSIAPFHIKGIETASRATVVKCPNHFDENKTCRCEIDVRDGEVIVKVCHPFTQVETT